MKLFRALLLIALLFLLAASPATAEGAGDDGGNALIRADLAWWGWALLLFGFTVVLGIVAVIGGVGGGVLFVPIVSAFFPFHFDFVRGAGLMVALCGALSASPVLLKRGLASMRLGLPMALAGSIGSTLGAMLGLALPASLVQGLLGVAILAIVTLMLVARRSEFPAVDSQDPLARLLGIKGSYFDPSLGRKVDWKTHRTVLGLAAFLFIGVLGGMFGLGAGWANVPALNLLLGAPIKVAVATSGFVLTITSSGAAWVYLNSGAVLALVTIPSVTGMMIGTRLGALVLPRVKAQVVRWIVVGILGISGVRSIFAGFFGG